jgi:hypothetical protein
VLSEANLNAFAIVPYPQTFFRLPSRTFIIHFPGIKSNQDNAGAVD